MFEKKQNGTQKKRNGEKPQPRPRKTKAGTAGPNKTGKTQPRSRSTRPVNVFFDELCKKHPARQRVRDAGCLMAEPPFSFRSDTKDERAHANKQQVDIGADTCTVTQGAVKNGNGCTRVGADADVEASNERELTLLRLAVISGKTAEMRVLLDASADVNARDNHGSTPLHSAVSQDKAEMVGALLDAGADVEASNERELTSVHGGTRRRRAQRTREAERAGR
jgi:hypothetical protein